MKRLLAFGIAGTSGFITDAGLLHLMITYTGIGPYSARVLSIAAAMLVRARVGVSTCFPKLAFGSFG